MGRAGLDLKIASLGGSGDNVHQNTKNKSKGAIAVNSEKPDDAEENLDEQDVAASIAALGDLAKTDPDAFKHIVAAALSEEEIKELIEASQNEGKKKQKPKASKKKKKS